MQTKANLRKWCALLAAIIAYFIIHEGCHALAALGFGSFEKIRLLGLGVQIVTQSGVMSNAQTALFCLAGPLGALLAGYLLAGAARHIIRLPGQLLKAVGYYTTLVLLLVDPIYLTVLYKFVGGGDMNGLKMLGLPELLLQIIFGVITVLNLIDKVQ